MVLKDLGSYDVIFNGRKLKVDELANGTIVVQGHTYLPEFWRSLKNQWIVQVSGFEFRLEYFDGRIFVNGKETEFSFHVSVPKLQRGTGKSIPRQNIIQAIIPGTIVEILVQSGDEVQQGQTLLYLEAMKMRNEIRAPISGSITTLNVQLNQKVVKNHTLVVIEPISRESDL